MTKPIPSNNPHFYAVVSDAVYEKDKVASQSYIQKSYPDAQVLEEQTVFFLWKFILVKRGDELTVAFRGIQNTALEFIPATFDHIGAPIPLIKGMEDHITRWQTKYGKIEVLTGHSKGGYFASRVMLCADLFRITFNGQYVLEGEKNINFRTEGDWIYNLRFSDKSLSICIGPGGHRIIYSIRNLVGRKWSDLSSVFMTPQQTIPHASSSSFQVSELVSTSQQLLTDPQMVHQLLQASDNPSLDGRVQLFPGDPVYPGRSYPPIIAAHDSTQDLNGLFIGPNILSGCMMPWEVIQNASTGVATLSTSVELPLDEVAQLESLSTFDWDPSLPDLIYIPRSPDSSGRKKPSFFERSRIIGIREGEARVGGRGIILALASGAEVSVSSADNKLITGISAPFSADILSSIGSGFMYAAPAAAMMLVIYQAGQFYQKRFYNRLKKDDKDTKKDLKKVNLSVQQFNTFLDDFSQGRINQEAFLARINDLSTQIHHASRAMARRGRYLDQHRDAKTTEGGRAFLTHFASKTKLRQVDRDLETIAAAAVAQREVQDQYTPKLKERPLNVLCDDLRALFDKRVLSIHEKYQQDALIQEIFGRVKHEDVKGLSHLDALTQQPAAISLQAPGIAKPMHLSGKHFVNGSSTSKSRRAERVKNWANALDAAYQHFRDVALTGNVDELEKAGRAVFDQLELVKQKNWDTYKILVKNPESDHPFKGSGEYYQSFIAAIESNTQATLAKARAAKTGAVQADSPVLFTEKELSSMKAEAAINAFNAALTSFQGKGEGEVDKDTAFGQMYDAAQVLDSLKHQSESEEENQLVQSTLSVGRDYGTYSNYQRALDRLKTIQTDLEILQSATEKMKDPSIKKEEHAKQYKLAHESAARLKEQGIVEEDVAKLIDNPENVRQVLDSVHSVYENYPHYVRVGHYENTALHVFSTPLVRFGLHVLNDLHRFEGYTTLKYVGWGLSTTQTIAPGALSYIVNWTLALSRGESSAVRGALSQRVYGAFANNVFTASAGLVRSPLATFARANSLSKRTNLATSTGVALQLSAALIVTITARLFGETRRVTTFNTIVSSVPATLINVTNALYFANLLNKTNKYLRAGMLSLKLHKVGQGWAGLSLVGFDLYEISATDPAELTNSNIVTRLVKKVLPKYHGSLPETKKYYEGKDVAALAVTAVAVGSSGNSLLVGLAAFQLGAMLYNRYFGSYTDNALSSILANCRFQLRQFPTDERNQALAKSLENLAEHLQGNYRIDKKSDSIVKQQAKLFYVECNVDELEKKEDWDAIIVQTTIVFEDNTYKFSALNLDVFDSVNLLFKHFSAASQRPAHIMKKIGEIETISHYFKRRFSELPSQEKEKAKDDISAIEENLARIKSTLLSNYGMFYVKGRLPSTPWVALRMFDALPNTHRDLVDWWVLGCLVHKLKNNSEDPTDIKMMAIERFCFVAVVDLLQKKQEALSKFEQEVRRSSQEMLTALSTTLPEGYTGIHVSTETQNFSQVIGDILGVNPPSILNNWKISSY